MSDDRRFPVLRSGLPHDTACPRSVPWSLVESHAEQAKENHDQTLERLAERGGLCPSELWLIVHDQPLRIRRMPDEAASVAWLIGVAHA